MIKAKKSLGQNFLVDLKVLDTITNLIDIDSRTIIEIGPGTGALTSYILKKNPKKLIVVEKDNDLAVFLSKKFNNQIEIINKDILKIDENLLSNDKSIVFGNLPYNISTEILTKWIFNLKDNTWFDYLILMFQKEVADRIISDYNSSNYGRLSILTNWRLSVKKILDIKPSAFKPKPKVDSTLLLFEPKKNFFRLKNPKNLEHVTRIFFSNRRKMLKKPYNQIFNGNKKILEELKINLNLRPQNLDFETYFQLTKEFEKLRT